MKIRDLTKSGTTEVKNTASTRLGVEFIQPWSNMICKIKLDDDMFEELQKLYSYVKEQKWKSFGRQLVGQINEEPEVTPEIMEKFPIWTNFCLQTTAEYVRTAMSQVLFCEKEKMSDFLKEKIMTRVTTMWFVNQKPGEYNPAHIHTNCKVSAVVYLQTPKEQVKGRKDHYLSDGKITFMNNTGTDLNFSSSQCSFEPKPGEMYIFPALQHHMVWPYRSANPDDSRVSLSFNADYTSESKLIEEQKMQEQMYQDMKKHKESEVKNDKSTDVSDINKSG